MKRLRFIFALLAVVSVFASAAFAQQPASLMARLKYDGGGDWYNDKSADINLLDFVSRETNLKTTADYIFADIATDEIFSYPFLFMTGHGNVTFSNAEADRLRQYLEGGGFLYIDDDYGLDAAVRREMKKVFPNRDFVELPYSHPLYTIMFDFPSGPPKTHEHDNKPPQGFGIFIGDRLAVYYTLEANPSDGWADAEVHNNPPEKREEALRFGTNILLYALTQ